MDTLDKLIEEEIARQVSAKTQIAPVRYGVWVVGEGWLRSMNKEHYFADARIQMAMSAAKLYGGKTKIMPFDDSLKDLQDIFIEREQKRLARGLIAWVRRLMKLGMARPIS